MVLVLVEIKIEIDDFNYESAVEEYLPIITQNIANHEEAGFIIKMLDKNSSLSAKAAKAALSILPQNTKDEIAVAIIKKYQDELKKNLMEFATKKGISFQINDLQITSK